MTGRRTGSRKRRWSPVLAAVFAVVVAGAAIAYWATSGSGSAAATTGTTSALTLAPGTPAAQLFPGGQADVVLTVTNPNVGSVRIGSFVSDPSQGSNGFGVDAPHSACNLAALSFTTQTNGGAGWNIPGSSTVALTLTNALSMAPSAANACQGATFTVYLSVTP